MGTNFYTTVFDEEDKTTKELHIGKSSAGWCFALHAIPERNLMSWEDWCVFLKDKKIYNEYGNSLTLDEMDNKVTSRSWGREEGWRLQKGYSSWEDFFNKNQAQLGPDGLLRHKISDRCILHGDSTWDLMLGEFC